MGEKERSAAMDGNPSAVREAGPGGGAPEPAEGIDWGDSAQGAVERQTPKRDFGDRMAAGGNVETDPGGGEPTPAESAIVKSKSNITNNRTD